MYSRLIANNAGTELFQWSTPIFVDQTPAVMGDVQNGVDWKTSIKYQAYNDRVRLSCSTMLQADGISLVCLVCLIPDVHCVLNVIFQVDITLAVSPLGEGLFCKTYHQMIDLETFNTTW